MELTKSYNITQSNENLLNNEQINNQNNSKKVVDQYFIEENNQDNRNSKKNDVFTVVFLRYRILVPIGVFILLGAFIIPSVVIDEKMLDKFLKITFISFGVIFSLLLLIFSNNKITIKKDIENNMVQIKLINFLCFPKLKFDCHIKDISFSTIYSSSYDPETGTSSESYSLSIYNSNKNFIVLNENKIKTKPVIFYYSFDNISIGINQSESQFRYKINKFISSEGNSNVNFNYQNKNIEVVSDRFFIHNLRNSNGRTCFDIFIIIIAIIFNIGIFSGVMVLLVNNKDFNLRIMGICSIPGFNIILYIIYKSIKIIKENIIRIDCMYSKNFDKIFIGLVKYTKTSYVNRFEYEIKDIERFTLNKEGDYYKLKVELKNKEIQQIYTIKNRTKEDLEELAYFLNKQFINNNV